MADDAGKQQPPSLDEFSKRLDAARGARPSANPNGAGKGAALGRAFRVASELFAAVLVGTLLGAGLDAALRASPWFLLAGIALGFLAGLRNLSRALTADRAASPPGGADEDGNEGRR